MQQVVFDVPYTEDRNRFTSAFRFFLAIPHLFLVGGPLAIGFSLAWDEGPLRFDWGMGGGALGAVAALGALISWFAILFTANHPDGLWKLAEFYLRWRVRAVAYMALLRDEYPPFGEAPYPAELEIDTPTVPRDRVSVAFRIILAIPHLIAVWALGLAWGLSTAVAWVAILFTGRYPESLLDFALKVFRWNIRVDAYLLLMTDQYPPFSLD
jgi:hypothetical protein